MLESLVCHLLVLWTFRNCLMCLNLFVLIYSLTHSKLFVEYMPVTSLCVGDKAGDTTQKSLPWWSSHSTRWRHILKTKESKGYNMKMTVSVMKKTKTRKGDRKCLGRERGCRGDAVVSWVVGEALTEKV